MDVTEIVVDRWDAETIKELVKRLEAHYPHSYSTLKTIYKEANKMLEEVLR